MPLYAYSLVALAAIAAWVAMHHGLVAMRQRNPVQRSFALLAIVVSVQCLARLCFHLSDDLPRLLHIDLLCWCLQLLECWLLTDFVDRSTGSRARTFVYAVGVALALLMAALFAMPHGYFAEAPRGMIMNRLSWGEMMPTIDVPYGLGYWGLVAIALACFLRTLHLAWSAWWRTRQHRHLALLGSLLLILLAVGANVVADTLGIVMVPLVEHGFAALALVMGIVLTDQALAASRLEERLRRNERLTALGQLAGGVAHDFGNILTGVIGSAELLEGSLSDRPRDLELVKAVSVSGRRGLALVQQLTAFASGRQTSPERIELHSVLREVAGLIQTGRGRAINIDFKLHAPLTEVDGDPTQLHSLVLNLLVNARDAMGVAGNGRIVIESGLGQPADGTRLRHHPKGEHLVWFSISDSGPGIPPEVLPRIFDPYFSTKGQDGSGIGLAQVDKALLALGGAVLVDSTPGRGTCFKIWLPLTDDSSFFLPAADTRVLVWIEDATLRLLIGQTLDALGYHAVLSPHGLQPTDIEAVVMEGDRPAPDDLRRFEHMPVVRLGGPDSAASHRLITLPKPFEPRDLATALRTLVIAHGHH
jgi:signal transduction histidine kinase